MLTFLPYLLIFLGFGLAIWSKLLLTPINNLSYSAVVHDAIHHASSIVDGLFNHKVEQYQMQYDVFWNLGLPGTLLIIATFSMIMAFRMIFSDVKRNNTRLKIDVILKGAILGLTLLFIIVFLVNAGKFILLSLLVSASMLFVLMMIPFLIFMFFKTEKN